MSLCLQNIVRQINGNSVISRLSFDVADGECLALLGPSGCGKSTTLRLIAGLDKPDSGNIILDNKDVTNIPAVNRRVGMVFQSYALFPHLSVADNLSLGLKVRGISKHTQREKVTSIISLMQLEDFANRLPSQLSGGQRQRVALARALLRDPLIYLLDEPMSNLDAQLREELRPELRKLILQGGQPVVYVTHDQHEAMAMADRIAVLKDGKLEQIGSPEELYESPISLFVASFIGRPQINKVSNQSGKIIAIRPEDIRLDPQGTQCKLIHREWLGTNQLWFLESDIGSLRMYCDANIEIPERILISWDSKKEHHFDSITGRRVQ